MNKLELMDSGWQTEKTLEYLLMGEKDSHNRKQLREDGNKLEQRIFERTDKIEEKLLFGLKIRE